jgi:hypothetical protein
LASKKTNLLMAPTGDHPFTALLLLLAGVIILALQDSLIKFIADSTSFWQIQTLRSTGNMLLIICLALMGGGIRLIYPRRLAGCRHAQPCHGCLHVLLFFGIAFFKRRTNGCLDFIPTRYLFHCLPRHCLLKPLENGAFRHWSLARLAHVSC